MKILKHPMKILALVLLVSLGSCNEKYPDLGDGLFAEFVTNKGTMVAKLTYDKTPVTVANFVALAEGNHPMVDSTFKGKKYFNGIIFHRVIDQFMIQGGDPTATGSGNPGYRFTDEFDESLKHDKPGILSMANSGPGTNGSQFFITEVPTPNLDNRHAVFGELVVGLDIQDSISNVKTGDRDKPEEDVVIEELNIIRQGYDARNFDAVKTWETELPKLDERKRKLAEEARVKAEEERKVAEEKSAAASAETLPILDGYKSKANTLASGLMVHYITKGNGPKPVQGQKAKVHYEGYFVDGRLFDSSRRDLEEKYGMYRQAKEERGFYGPMAMLVSPDAPMIPGFREALSVMRVGDKAYFYLPSHLAYGENGRGNIKPNTDLIFVVEMFEIEK